jgi:large subunit ribosomal protein L37Ae
MGKKKVVGIAGRFGPRYGSTLRKRWKQVMESRYSPHTCPICGIKGRVKRISVGLWECTYCGAVFAGAAYVPFSGLSKVQKRK